MPARRLDQPRGEASVHPPLRRATCRSRDRPRSLLVDRAIDTLRQAPAAMSNRRNQGIADARVARRTLPGRQRTSKQPFSARRGSSSLHRELRRTRGEARPVLRQLAPMTARPGGGEPVPAAPWRARSLITSPDASKGTRRSRHLSHLTSSGIRTARVRMTGSGLKQAGRERTAGRAGACAGRQPTGVTPFLRLEFRGPA
jgi:hypothetical protein